MKSFKSLFLANVKQYIRDGGTVFLTLIFPIILVVIFGFLFNEKTSETAFNIGIVEADNEIYQSVVNTLSESFNLITYDRSVNMEVLENGEIDILLALPDIDLEEFKDKEKYEIEVFYDSTKENSVIISGIIKNFFLEFEDTISGKERKISLIEKSIKDEEKVNRFNYLLPGVLALTITQLGLLGSLDFLSLREKKIIKSLSVTPLSRRMLFLSELVLRVIIAFVQTIIILVSARLLFGVTTVGNPIYLILMVLLGALAFTSIGYLLISFVNSFVAGNLLLQIIILIMMFLSGIFFPIETLPAYLKPITKVIPLSYFGDALRQVMLGLKGDYGMHMNIIILSFVLVLSSIITFRLWKWE